MNKIYSMDLAERIERTVLTDLHRIPRQEIGIEFGGSTTKIEISAAALKTMPQHKIDLMINAAQRIADSNNYAATAGIIHYSTNLSKHYRMQPRDDDHPHGGPAAYETRLQKDLEREGDHIGLVGPKNLRQKFLRGAGSIVLTIKPRPKAK